jgi:hypothetical protein
MSTLSRRGFLGGVAGLGAVLAVGDVARASEGSRIKSIVRDARGTTFALSLSHAPFPAPNAGYTDDTVLAFVPAHYRFERHERVATIVHFHGHNTTADRAIRAHELREQLVDSRQNAILLVPQLAALSADSSCGKLEARGGLARMLDEALFVLGSREARGSLGPSAVGEGAGAGTVCLSAHSGGYHAAACSIRAGGVEVTEVWLFDGLYADIDAFHDWTIAGKGRPQRSRHKLVSYYTEGTTAALSRVLLGALERAGVQCVHEEVEGSISRAELTRAEAVFIRTAQWHSNITYESNALRDCLFASALPRHLPSTWFARKNGARPIERRR